MTYNKGPQYDKRPEIKNYKKESSFKVPRNFVVIGFVGAVIISFFLFFKPFSSIEKDLVDTKWEFSDSDYKEMTFFNASSNNFYFIQLQAKMYIFSNVHTRSRIKVREQSAIANKCRVDVPYSN